MSCSDTVATVLMYCAQALLPLNEATTVLLLQKCHPQSDPLSLFTVHPAHYQPVLLKLTVGSQASKLCLELRDVTLLRL